MEILVEEDNLRDRIRKAQKGDKRVVMSQTSFRS